MRTELLEQLKNAYEYHRILLLHQEAIKELEKKKKSCEAQYRAVTHKSFPIAAVGIGLGVFFGAQILVLPLIALVGPAIVVLFIAIGSLLGFESSVMGMLAFLVFVAISELVAVGVAIWLPMIYEKKRQAKENAKIKKYFETVYTPAMKEINEELKDAQESLTEHATTYNYVLDFLPPDYRSWVAVFYMHDAVENYRADALKEAINLYEEQLHRWNVEDQMEEQKRVMRKMLIEQARTRESTDKLRQIAAIQGVYNISKDIAESFKK